MPLQEKAKVEVYLPDLPKAAYQDLLQAFEEEFTYAFGGCTIMRGLDGSYLSQAGLQMKDRVNIVYTHTPYTFDKNFDTLAAYADALHRAAFKSLEEEAILVVVSKIYHAE